MARGQARLHRWGPCLSSEFQCAMRPNEVVIATEQFEVIFQTLFSSCITDCSSEQISRTLPDRQIQPFHIRGVQFPGVFGVAPCPLPFPRCSHSDLAFHLDHAIIPTFLNDLTEETRRFKYPLHHCFVKLKAIGCDQRTIMSFHTLRKIAE